MKLYGLKQLYEAIRAKSFVLFSCNLYLQDLVVQDTERNVYQHPMHPLAQNQSQNQNQVWHC